MLGALEPEEGMTVEQQATARGDQYQFVQERKQDVFTRGATSCCERHGRECLTIPQPAEGHRMKVKGGLNSQAGSLHKFLRVHFA